ncbi:unannotated protein [freshwater metagenome]|uniref:Unannotated protein n=1 Tax=freshwater metagenome TaxID=449393 RepID=A0A6J6UUM5_9ZZZZ
MVVVEDWAHRPYGHFPNRFAELADGLADLGVHVEVLTSRGWLHSNTRAHRWTVHSYGRVSEALARAAFWIEFRADRKSRAPGPVIIALVSLLRTAAAWHEARRVAQRIVQTGAAQRCGIVLLNMRSTPSVLARGSRAVPWIVHQFAVNSPLAFVDRVRLPSPARRTSVRSACALAVPSPEWVPPLQRRLPSVTVAPVRLAGVRPVRATSGDSRAALGLHPEASVALLFGTHIADHDPLTVVRALAMLGDWQLLVVGSVNQMIDSAMADDDPLLRRAIRLRGTVSEETRDHALRSVDLSVLSFAAGYSLNSGTLMDAISYGKPIVVSTPSAAAEVVVRYRIGETFLAGDAADLCRAIRAVDHGSIGSSMAGAQEALNNRRIATAHLELLHDLARGDGRLLAERSSTVRP